MNFIESFREKKIWGKKHYREVFTRHLCLQRKHFDMNTY